MEWLKRHRVKVGLSLLSGCLFVWLLHIANLPWLPERSTLDRAEWWALPLYLVVWSVVHVLRAARWQLLLAPIATVSMRRLIAVSFVGFAAIVVLPLRSGEIVRPALIRQKGQLSGWSAIGTVGAERIIDGLFLALMLWVGLLVSDPLSPLPETIGNLEVSPRVVPLTAYVALGIFGCAFAAMAAFYFARDWARMMVRKTIGIASQPLAIWLSERVERVTDGLKFLPRKEYTLPFVALTAVYWLLNAFATSWLASGVGLEGLDLARACVVTGVLALGVMVPNAPGFLGAFQLSVFAALSLFYPESELLTLGGGFVFLLFVGQTAVTLGGGVLGAFMLRTSFGAALNTSDAEFAE